MSTNYSSMPHKLLIIDDDADLCHLLSRYLSKKGFFVETAYSGAKGIAKYKATHYDVVIADYRLGDIDGIELVRVLKEFDPKVVVVIITGYSEIKLAVETIKMGAIDYIQKPLVPEELVKLLQKIDTGGETPVSVAGTPDPSKTTNNVTVAGDSEFFIGASPMTCELYRQVAIVANTKYSVILYGESGTGKEVIAQTIHNQSDRAHRPFVALDCGTLSRELAGSELFGHVKGSFTGAIQDKEGHFEMANGGTLFLDEIGNLPLEIQAALLRVIQERKFKRIGGNKEQVTNVRIIVASNEDLRAACREGKFREDLYHRLNEFEIDLPSLRERKEDIEPLAFFFLAKCCAESGKRVSGISPEVCKLFKNYTWPGNLREMRNVIRRATLLTPENTSLQVQSLLPDLLTNAPVNETIALEKPATDNLKEVAGRAEYKTIMSVLQKVNFNKKKAAEFLNIDRKTLYNKLKQYQEGE